MSEEMRPIVKPNICSRCFVNQDMGYSKIYDRETHSFINCPDDKKHYDVWTVSERVAIDHGTIPPMIARLEIRALKTCPYFIEHMLDEDSEIESVGADIGEIFEDILEEYMMEKEDEEGYVENKMITSDGELKKLNIKRPT